jgi:NADH-quinone oxidoreductase subunit N
MNTETLLTAMLPEHLLLLGMLLLIVLEIGARRPREFLPVTLVVLFAAAFAAARLYVGDYAASPFPGQFSVDPAASLGKAVLIALTLPVVLIAGGEFKGPRFSILLLSSLYGACLILSSDSFLTLFLGIELMSLPVYALVLLAYAREESAEGALKYLVLGGAGTASLLLGISFVFGATGSFGMPAFAEALGRGDTMAQAAVVLILIAFYLKAAVVPFHAWAPDAYEAASVPVTAYMATVIKSAVLLAAVRLFAGSEVPPAYVALLAGLPLVSMVWGNLTAMRQESFRRMIAYSSIAHAGYLFYAFLGPAEGRFEAVVFYVIAYGLMNLLAFVCLPAGADASRDRLDNLKGLFRRNPYAAVLIAAAMLSLAGIPPFPGFVAKFLIFRNVIEAGYTAWAVAGLIGSYLGIYFYLRVIQYMFMSAGEEAAEATPSRAMVFAASLACLLPVILLTVFPGWLLDRI